MPWWGVAILLPIVIVALVFLLRWSDQWQPRPRYRRTSDAPEGEFPWLPGAEPGKKTQPPSSPPPSPIDENVQFTVFRPAVATPEKWSDLLVFMHLSERRNNAPEDTPDPVEEVEKQARTILGQKAEQHVRLRQESKQPVPRASDITIIPSLEGFEFNPPQQTFRWHEGVHRADFRMRPSASVVGAKARGTIQVFLGWLLLADITLVVRVAAEGTSLPARAKTRTTSARPYRKIFPSYSHKDTDLVTKMEHYMQTLGDKYLTDVRELRAGQVWKKRLARRIKEADVFQLFWSHNAMASENVRAEWEYALKLRRPGFIRPVYWESPMPNDPIQNLPPPALSKLHFHYLALPSRPSLITHASVFTLVGGAMVGIAVLFFWLQSSPGSTTTPPHPYPATAALGGGGARLNPAIPDPPIDEWPSNIVLTSLSADPIDSGAAPWVLDRSLDCHAQLAKLCTEQPERCSQICSEFTIQYCLAWDVQCIRSAFLESDHSIERCHCATNRNREVMSFPLRPHDNQSHKATQ